MLRSLLGDGARLALVIGADPPGTLPRAPSSASPAALPSNPLRTVSAAAELHGVPRVGTGGGARMASAARLDLVWCTEASFVPPDLPPATPGGVWLLQVDDGDPGCASALIRSTPTVPVRLLRLTQGVERAEILAEAHFLNEPFAPSLTRARVLYGGAGLPARQLRAWALRGPDRSTDPEVPVRGAGAGGRHAGVLVLARQLLGLGKRAWSSCFRDQWGVGMSRRPVSAFLKGTGSPDITWMDGSKRGYHADPFGIDTAEGPVLLAEGWDHRRGRGRIDALRPWPDGSILTERDVLPSAGHVSYPYLLRHEGQVYCVPETHEARRVDLYRAERFPRRWTLAATLIDDFAGVDPTVFRHDGHWWLFCGNQDDEPYGNVYGFFADDLLGPWRPHPLNPLKRDPRSARPAGTPFRHEGVLYRPAQDCSVGYGGAVVINRVLALSPTAFEEVPVRRIAPDPSGPYPHGLHTLSAVGGGTALDGMRRVFAPGAALRAARHYLRRLSRYRGGTGPPTWAGSRGTAD